MTKTISKIALFVSVFSVGFFSCQTELLDPVPKTSLSDLVVFDTPDRIALQVNNMYSAMKSGAFLGGRYQIYGDVRANDFLNRTTNAVTAYQVWNHTLTETSTNDVINLWNTAYAAINQMNVFIEGMESNTAKFVPPTFPADFATVTAPAYIAEARFLRAVAYYSLLQLYARPFANSAGNNPGLPLRIIAQKSSLNNDLARSTVAEVYTQILSDLTFAESNLPLTYSSALLRVTRAHRNSAIAFKTRVHLSKGDYAAVITDANKIVPATAPFVAASGVAHAIMPTVTEVFATPQETVESIFSFPFTAQNTPGGQSQLGFYYLASSPASFTTAKAGGGEFSLNAGAGSLVANTVDFPVTDARRTNFVYIYNGESYLKKYSEGTPYIDKAPIIRYPEVILSLAEAIARTTAGVDARALSLLNAIRTRSDVTPLAPVTNDELINAIIMERRIEFLGEGIRNQDLMRLNATIPAKGAVPQVLSTAANYIWPIPQPELATNALMTQNF